MKQIDSSTHIEILCIGGTPCEGSKSGQLLHDVSNRVANAGANVTIADLHELDLPMLKRTLPLEAYPRGVTDFVNAVNQSEAVVLCTATHFATMPGSFKNALDLLIYGGDKPFAGKPIGIVAYGGQNGMYSLSMASIVAEALGGVVLPSKVLVPHGGLVAGRVSNADMEPRLNDMARELVAYAAKLRPKHVQENVA